MTLTPEKLDELERLAELATPGPYSCVNGETITLRAPDGSRLAQMTFLTKRGRRDADEVAKTARMLASLDPATVRELVRLARIGLTSSGESGVQRGGRAIQWPEGINTAEMPEDGAV